MAGGKEQKRRRYALRMCPTHPNRANRHGSRASALHEVHSSLLPSELHTDRRTEVQTYGGREKLVTEKDLSVFLDPIEEWRELPISGFLTVCYRKGKYYAVLKAVSGNTGDRMTIKMHDIRSVQIQIHTHTQLGLQMCWTV
jgi:hypothetical protein